MHARNNNNKAEFLDFILFDNAKIGFIFQGLLLQQCVAFSRKKKKKKI